ncbi:UDP-N-acetylglucosamine 2-epimerase [Helicobacter canadensis]|uniref:UDP-N-acetylglucosamine 2-epimerase n=1 Tax=Helicobacter canadensis MIT 98-5491 TaxID=537970 RepID=C5ZW59_9HELI|nr:UDP-N-acetylglucosamine 2-epimerase [Helicobacter canadensis]EES88880.1 UDP-N-acetylglucosamine 2-epimerase [Helicobacter canadensis MIT 98-5491]EFR48813.1 UDP-N-acetyl-D-glucosamine 2-epimerase, UDP-hydrolysing [Helicobacter canadensis MIT 98-5491]STP00150.1 N-acetylneuraminic acid synthetase [Helicobacter canadensis]
MIKKIVFLSGTRADFGKIKSLLQVCADLDSVEYSVFVTGMHMLSKYGSTFKEIDRFTTKTYKFINCFEGEPMEIVLSNTIDGFSKYVHEYKPDLIVVHGDRVEALAGSIVGSLNNVLVAHIEGGEKSGTVDEIMRHAITKMSHIHLVANQEARNRIVQMGEIAENVFIIGSPDIDIMCSKLPDIDVVREKYQIKYENYHIVLFHPVTTELDRFEKYASIFVEALLESSEENYVVIYPNNDMGSALILKQYEKFKGRNNFRLFPSINFECFLTLMKNATSVIGNSSAGIREAPFYNIPSINIGTRQMGRSNIETILNVDYDKEQIKAAIKEIIQAKTNVNNNIDRVRFGEGSSAKQFKKLIKSEKIWNVSVQKHFVDR